MSPQGPFGGSQAPQGEVAACATPAPQHTHTEPPQKVAKLLQKLDDLLFLSGKESEL